MSIYQHPIKTIVTREQARAWSPADYCILRKYDGAFAVRACGDSILLGELMKTRSGQFQTAFDREMSKRFPAGWFAAWGIASISGENMLQRPARVRWAALQALSGDFPADMVLAEQISDVDACFASGAEGVVAVPWGDVYGGMLCAKVEDIFTVRVTGRVGNTQSVFIADSQSGQPRGAVKLGGGKCDCVGVGSIIRVAGLGLTDAGKIRQPTPCREYLVKF